MFSVLSFNYLSKALSTCYVYVTCFMHFSGDALIFFDEKPVKERFPEEFAENEIQSHPPKKAKTDADHAAAQVLAPKSMEQELREARAVITRLKKTRDDLKIETLRKENDLRMDLAGVKVIQDVNPTS